LAGRVEAATTQPGGLSMMLDGRGVRALDGEVKVSSLHAPGDGLRLTEMTLAEAQAVCEIDRESEL
jgi:hypothetical protein